MIVSGSVLLATLSSCGEPRLVGVADAGEVLQLLDAGFKVVDAGQLIIDAGPVDAGTIYYADASTTVVDAGVLNASGIVRFVAFGDQGKGDDAQRKVGLSVGKVCAALGCDFGVLLGDNFYESGVQSPTDPQFVTAFEQPYETVDAGFYIVLGNHDYGGNGQGTEFGKEQNEIDYGKTHPKWILPSQHYKYSAGPAEFFVADTNRSMFKQDDAVRTDFDKWLPASTQLWKIAFGHHTYFSNGKHGNAGNYDNIPPPLNVFPFNGSGVKRFVDEQVCGRADFYIDGHDHEREWLSKTCTKGGSTINTQFIVSGGGADVNGFDGAGAVPYYWRSENSGFLYVVIDGHSFTGTFYSADGVAEFTRTFTK